MGGTDPLAINDFGQIAGWYYDAQGNVHAFLATPSPDLFASTAAVPRADGVPEPSTWAMMMLGFAAVGLAGYRARHSRAPKRWGSFSLTGRKLLATTTPSRIES
jgi:PEP-CTERM motif